MAPVALCLSGDGIGPEVMREARRTLERVCDLYDISLRLIEAPFGGVAYDEQGVAFPEETRRLALDASAVLLAAVGGPKWDVLPRAERPEKALLELRGALGVYANLRPAKVSPHLAASSALKVERVVGMDVLIVRELLGGLYFSQPRGIETSADGARRGYNTAAYSEPEIERIARIAFAAANSRRGRLCSVDKANVLETSMLWREVVERVSADFPEVELSHMYVDNAAMQLVSKPLQFDVILTSNLFGDILSDLAAGVAGSIGLLPSASLGEGHRGLYEPCHGSAPDLAGRGVANPLAMIFSAAMMLRYSFQREDAACALEQAVERVLASGLRSADLLTDEYRQIADCREMGEAVVAEIAKV